MALMLLQAEVKGAHGHTPSKGTKVTPLHVSEHLHTFNTTISSGLTPVKPPTLRRMLSRT